MDEWHSTVPTYRRLSELKTALDECGHHLSIRTLRGRCANGDISALRTSGGQYRLTEKDFQHALDSLAGSPSREAGGPRVGEDPEKLYLRTLKQRYDLDPEDYLSMVQAQNGKCGICGCEPLHDYKDHSLKYRRLHVDHWHGKTHAVRGLLCYNCNFGVGRWLDNPDLLRAAIRYIEAHSFKRSA